ncbi:hypothetical protein MHYP_G00327270 [Metynnis hypsauchen]
MTSGPPLSALKGSVLQSRSYPARPASVIHCNGYDTLTNPDEINVTMTWGRVYTIDCALERRLLKPVFRTRPAFSGQDWLVVRRFQRCDWLSRIPSHVNPGPGGKILDGIRVGGYISFDNDY